MHKMIVGNCQFSTFVNNKGLDALLECFPFSLYLESDVFFILAILTVPYCHRHYSTTGGMTNIVTFIVMATLFQREF